MAQLATAIALTATVANASEDCSPQASGLFQQGEQAWLEDRVEDARSLYSEAVELCDTAAYWQALGQSWSGELSEVEGSANKALEFFGNAFSAARREQDDAAGASAARSIVEVGLLSGDPIKANSWLMVANQLQPEHPDLATLQDEVDAALEGLSVTEIEAGFSGSRGLGRVNQLLSGGVTANAFWDAGATEDATVSQLQIDPLADQGGGAGGASIAIPIKFESNSTELTPGTSRNIENLATVLASQPESMSITLIGHADVRGDADYNLRLSQQRAERIMGAVVSLQPALDGRVEALGRGDTQPVDTGASERAHANNRRLEISLSEQE